MNDKTISLNVKNVWNTRPAQNAHELHFMINQAGGKSILFPTIDIQLIPPSSKSMLSVFDEVRHLIFVSVNAVECFFQQYYLSAHYFQTRMLYAVGNITAQALNQQGYETVLHGGEQGGGDGLLALPELSTDYINQQGILIIRGQGGLDDMADTLKERGAHIHYLEVYQRVLPYYAMSDVNALWQTSPPDIIIITSQQGLSYLIDLTPESYQPRLLQTDLLLMSDRLAHFAKQIGFESNLWVSQKQHNQGLLAMLAIIL